MAKKTKKTTDNTQVQTKNVPEQQTSQVATLETLNATLVALNHLDNTSHSEAEVLATAQNVLVQYNAVLKNAGIMLIHSLQVYESLADRGFYPDELVKDSPTFKGRVGLADLKTVINQILPLFNTPQK